MIDSILSLMAILGLPCALLPYRVARLLVLGWVVLVGLAVGLTAALCRPGGCSGIPMAMVIFLSAPLAAGAFLGLLWRAWRGLRTIDLRHQPGWGPPSPWIRSGYLGALLAVSGLIASQLALLAAFKLGAVASEAPGQIGSFVLSLDLPILALPFALLRARALVIAPDALFVPSGRARRVAAGVVLLLVLVALFVLSAVGAAVRALPAGITMGVQWPLAALALALVELSRFERLQAQLATAPDTSFPATEVLR